MRKIMYLDVDYHRNPIDCRYIAYPTFLISYLKDYEIPVFMFFLKETQKLEIVRNHMAIRITDCIYSYQEIAEKLGMSYSSAKRACVNLEFTCILDSKRKSNKKVYSINYPLINCLNSLYGEKPDAFWSNLRRSGMDDLEKFLDIEYPDEHSYLF